MSAECPTPWVDLGTRDRERIVLLLGSLAEFSAGFNVTTSYTQFTSNPQDPPIRFLYQGIHQYLHAYYMDRPDTGVLPILRSIGLPEKAEEIEAILNSAMGKTTIRGFMSDWRNKIMSHPRFTAASIVHGVYAPAEVESNEAVEFFESALHHLCWTTIALHGFLRGAYPEADKIDRDRFDFPGNRELGLIS